MRGGELQVPDGRPPAGFFDSTPLPRGLSPGHRQQVEQALHHPGGTPYLEREQAGLSAKLSRVFAAREPVVNAGLWDVAICVIEDVEGDEIEWARSAAGEPRPYPLTPIEPGQAPWETAGRLIGAPRSHGRPAVRLARVEIAVDDPSLILVFAPAER
jgi:hypothetical protein